MRREGTTNDRLPVHVEQVVLCEWSVAGLRSAVWNRMALVIVVLDSTSVVATAIAVWDIPAEVGNRLERQTT